MTSEPEPIRLVTIAREFGSGGSDLARALGRRLGWSVLEDGEVVRRVARRLGAPLRDVEASDEHVRTLAERLGASLAGVFPELVLPPEGPRVDVEQVAEAAAAVLREAALSPHVVVVGHGGMCLFADRRDALHVRVVAPREHRIRQVAGRLDTTEAAAAEELDSRDADRHAWIRHHFGAEWGDPTLYHLVVNSGRVDPERGAALLEALMGSTPRS